MPVKLPMNLMQTVQCCRPCIFLMYTKEFVFAQVGQCFYSIGIGMNMKQQGSANHGVVLAAATPSRCAGAPMTAVHLLACFALIGATGIVPAAETGAAPTTTPLRPLDDAELGGVSTLVAPADSRQAKAPNSRAPVWRWPFTSFGGGAQQTGDLDFLLHPLFGLFNADVAVRDVSFGSPDLLPRLNTDGSLNLPLPATVGEIDLQNLRIGPNDGATFGTLQIKGMDLSRTVITITPTK